MRYNSTLFMLFVTFANILAAMKAQGSPEGKGTFDTTRDNTQKVLITLNQENIPETNRERVADAVTNAVDELLEIFNKKESYSYRHVSKYAERATAESIEKKLKEKMPSIATLTIILNGIKKHNIHLSQEKYDAIHETIGRQQEKEISYLAAALNESYMRYKTLESLKTDPTLHMTPDLLFIQATILAQKQIKEDEKSKLSDEKRQMK